jgi:hypothetical protein
MHITNSAPSHTLRYATLQYNILRRFFGLYTYYWMFIAGFANITPNSWKRSGLSSGY